MEKWREDLSLFPHLYIVRIWRQKSWEPIILGCWPVLELGKWRGSVPIDEAQHQLIGFCNTCFDKMEQNRPETDMGGEDEDDDLEPE